MVTRRFILFGLIGAGAAPGFSSAVDKPLLLIRSRGP